MDVQNEFNELSLQKNLSFLVKGIVEGFISGIHKSPFHGFSSEFSEHKIYNQGDSTRDIDWKRYAKTDRLYIKRYEEETNLRCHIIIDNSASMHFPEKKKMSIKNINKMGFTVLSALTLMELLKRQRDAVGLSIYAQEIEYYAPERGSDRHFRILYNTLSGLLDQKNSSKNTKTYTCLHQIIEKIHRRSLILFFTDMFQIETSKNALFEALRHLKYNKHEVVLFHTYDGPLEEALKYANHPTRFVDVESKESLNTFVADVQKSYHENVKAYFKEIELECSHYKIGYVKANISKGINQILNSYMREREKII